MEEMEASQRDRHRDIVSCVRGHRIKASTNKPASAANANQKKKGKKKKKKKGKKKKHMLLCLAEDGNARLRRRSDHR
jgi:hypothetical protein